MNIRENHGLQTIALLNITLQNITLQNISFAEPRIDNEKSKN
jgi:hypothetical protein